MSCMVVLTDINIIIIIAFLHNTDWSDYVQVLVQAW